MQVLEHGLALCGVSWQVLGGIIGDVCQVLVELRISDGLQYHGAHLSVEVFSGAALGSSFWEVVIGVVSGVRQLGRTTVQDLVPRDE